MPSVLKKKFKKSEEYLGRQVGLVGALKSKSQAAQQHTAGLLWGQEWVDNSNGRRNTDFYISVKDGGSDFFSCSSRTLAAI